MATRIAMNRGMAAGQEEEVKRMLLGLADTLFGGSDAQEPLYRTQLASMVQTSAVRRPASPELRRMADAIGQRCGEAQQQQAEAMLRLMTDIMFGPSDVQRQGGAERMGLAAVPRPSPRTLEAISRRVVARTGASGAAQEAAVQVMLQDITSAIFGPLGTNQNRRTPGIAEQVGEQVTSQLCTARSSVRSRSTTSTDMRREVNLEIRGLLTDLCGVLFTEEGLPDSSSHQDGQ